MSDITQKEKQSEMDSSFQHSAQFVICGDGHSENFGHLTIDLSDSSEIEESTLNTSQGSISTNMSGSEIQEVTPAISSRIRNVEPKSVSVSTKSTNSAKIEITEPGASFPTRTQCSPKPLNNENVGIIGTSYSSNKGTDLENLNANNVGLIPIPKVTESWWDETCAGRPPSGKIYGEPDFVYMYLEKTLTEATTNEKWDSNIDQHVQDQGEGTSITSVSSSTKQKLRSPTPSLENSGPVSPCPVQQNDTYKVLMRMSSRQRLLDKKNRLDRIVEEVKVSLRPYYNMRKITKDEYKEILRRAVDKVRQSKTWEIEPGKIVFFVRDYVRCVRARRGNESLPEQVDPGTPVFNFDRRL